MILERTCVEALVSVDTVLADAEAVAYHNFASGVVEVPTGSSITLLTFHVSCNGTTYLPLYAADNVTAITQAVTAGRAYALPATLAGAAYIKITGDADGTVNLHLKT
jgi:hypothetical protein